MVKNGNSLFQFVCAICSTSLAEPTLTKCCCTRLFSLTGQRCEINVNDCPVINPCCGHGFCIDGIDSYECLCEPGWDGPECCRPIDDCINNMCQVKS